MNEATCKVETFMIDTDCFGGATTLSSLSYVGIIVKMYKEQEFYCVMFKSDVILHTTAVNEY